eukprot:TRINITY_DN9487_c1_g1_i2.p1 TRINITY_DN9487_c1_g1~~TRINITY_DN9487_c1_g1_i2.p1  ORF type:complete len:298 (+),score=75.20 TRINITY_DN9487_c1_g1_i2:44-937(+)
MSASWWDLPYGPENTSDPEHSRFLRLWAEPDEVPDGGVHATVVTIHGGYWKNKFGLDDEYGNAGTASLAPFFRSRGFGVVELEYRRRDHEGGGWPGSNEDILSALKKLGELQGSASGDERCQKAMKSIRPDRFLLIGHSAGGCLALWAAHQLADSARPPAVLAAAPVADLVRGYEMKISDEGDAVELYMKQAPKDETSEAEYRKASPASLLPVKFPLVIAFGDKDSDVPPELVSEYGKAAKASAPPSLVSVIEVTGADHFDVVNAGSEAWLKHICPALAEMAERAGWGKASAQALSK